MRLSTNRRAAASAMLLVTLVASVTACGPGRGGRRRPYQHHPRPLVRKEHYPNMAENTIAASGPTEGNIPRDSAAFQDLVPIYDDDIIFKDEEGTGADRFMTQRCKEKLSTLAISVMNQWPGIRLRVTEGWDEQNHHSDHSLHYEGRAVDITTSDRDEQKYGMLARLAVEAGFDWVYYQSRTHVHCSVKSESSQAAKYGGCFTADSTVLTSTGVQRRLADLHIGERVLALDSTTNRLVYSEVLMFLDWDPKQRHQFLRFRLASGRQLTVTPAHLLLRQAEDGVSSAQSLYADQVTVNSTLLVTDDSSRDNSTVVPDRVVSIEVLLHTGIYAPLTAAGTIVVDGVVASCYASVDSVRLAHFVFAPVRAFDNVREGLAHMWHSISAALGSRATNMAATTTQPPPVGVHWYARVLYTIGQYVIPYKMHI